MRNRVYKTNVTYGLCVNVKPNTAAATLYLNLLEPIIDKCHMPNCNDKAVRVGVFSFSRLNDKSGCEFRGLCERHKQLGIWTNSDTAWGWCSAKC